MWALTRGRPRDLRHDPQDGESDHRGARGRRPRRGRAGGRTEAAQLRGGHDRDHPRLRGERTSRMCSMCATTWIIPACAGSADLAPPPRPNPRDHPRLRGERCRRDHDAGSGGGSSPPARGTLRVSTTCPDPSRVAGGIIPACAGSTCCRSRGRSPRRDHPRLRGERPRPPIGRWQLEGSSPPARGARLTQTARTDNKGIIPACAGSAKLDPTEVRDHPRLRGERQARPAARRIAWGSSPPARGARPAAVAACRPSGIIPARAGSAPWPISRPATCGDHPRLRGERPAP